MESRGWGCSTVRAGDIDRITKHVYISSSPQRSLAQAKCGLPGTKVFG